jgi:hypothetical protein
VSATSAEPRAAAEPWEQRFRAPAILFSQIAIDAPEVGIVSTNASGTTQLHRWDTTTGQLTQLTHEPTGRLLGFLTPDGRWVLYLRDEGGNEIGHWAVVPTSGGDEIDLTPGLAPYASEQIAFARSRGRVAFVTAADDTFAIRFGTIGDDGTIGDLRTLHHSGATLAELAISADGGLVACSSAHRSSGLEYSVITIDTATDDPSAALWDGEGTSLVVHSFAPGRDDRRLLVTTNLSGRERASIWDLASNARQDLPPAAPSGDLLPIGWAPDGSAILLCRIEQAEQRLVVWELGPNVVRELDHPAGALMGFLRIGATYYRPDGREIVCRWESFAEPCRLIGLDPATGRQTRTAGWPASRSPTGS